MHPVIPHKLVLFPAVILLCWCLCDDVPQEQRSMWCSLSMLQNQCELWSGPIAAVAYMPLLNGKLVSMDDAALNGTSVEEQKAKLAMFYETVTHAGQHADC